MTRNKKVVTNELYFKYKDLVINICRKFKRSYERSLNNEELEDLTQACWESIIKKYNTYDEEKSKLSTWVVIVTKSALYDIIKQLTADKRAILQHSISLDQQCNGKDRFL